MAESAAEIEAEWWDEWWKADWSWARLAEKEVGENLHETHGGAHGEMDLQAYWRRDPTTGKARDDDEMNEAGELMLAPDGALWHLAHVPLHWRDGVPAKAGWNATQRGRLAALIDARLALALVTKTDEYCVAEGPDGRAQLSGTVLLEWSDSQDDSYHVVCDGARLPLWRSLGWSFGPGFRCQRAHFVEGAQLDRAHFYGHALFDSAIFSGDALFGMVEFSGTARFDRTTFSGFAGFNHATFLADASFHRATFSGGAGFGSATFSGSAGFFMATFLEYARFERATVSDTADFGSATFSGDARFGSAAFAGDASFTSASVSGKADFDSASFSGDALFDQGEFKAGAYFDSAVFGGQAKQPSDKAAISFTGRRFKDITSFHSAAFHQCANFKATVFERNARFSSLTLPKTLVLWQGMFDQAQFKDIANFRGSGCRAFAAFDGAVFGGELQFDDSAEPDANRQFRQELTAALALPAPGKTPAEAEPPADVREAALKHLERGCRVLKQAMAKSADKQREQMFFAFELIARREQTHVARSEKIASWLYEKTSDYGRSIALPLGWLALLYLVCVSLYGLLALAQQFPPQVRWAELWTLSAHRMLPIGAWNVEKSPLQELIFAKGDNPLAFAARSLASLQSLISVVLIFQLLLVIRRRFQIS